MHASGPADEPTKVAAGAVTTAPTTDAPRRLPQPPAPGRLPEVGEQFGPYRIEAQVGAGGMGVVYRATQLHPVTRTVALKLTRIEFRDELGYAMFLVERQALAGLDHPCIARVFDAGQAVSDTLYFAMEWIDGAPLDTWCRAHAPSPRAIVGLLLQVCRGIGHAHSRGIVHRDLKPANILVQTVDGRALPRIIDFGIAATPGRQATGASGTVGYMSPEQASGGDCDARTDVYALAVLACELLAERAGTDLGRWWELPAEERGRWFGGRTRDLPAPLRGVFDRDLRAILERALQPDPAARYAHAGALADDLQAWLDGFPVRARPRTRRYVLARWVGRHRLAVVVAAAFAIALFALSLYAWFGWRLAERQRLEADQAALFLESVLGSVDPEYAMGLDKQLMLRVLADAAARLTRELAESPRVRARVAATIGRSYVGISEPGKALSLIDALRDGLARDLGVGAEDVLELDAVRLSALRMSGQTGPAHAWALELLQRARVDHDAAAPLVLATSATLMRSHVDRGEIERAREIGEQALAAARSAGAAGSELALLQKELAEVRGRLGDRDQAVELMQAAAATVAADSGAESLAAIELRAEVAAMLFMARRFDEAVAIYRDVIPLYTRVLGPEHIKTLTMRGNLAATQIWHDPSAAADQLAGLAAIRRRTLGAKHPDTVQTLGNLAAALWHAKRFEEAAAAFQDYLPLCEEIRSPGHPSCAERRAGLGKALRELGRHAEAEVALLAAWEQKRTAQDANFASPETVAGEIAELYRRWGKPALAEQWQARAGQGAR